MENNKGINVLSCFDGMSCGRIALERAGIKVDNYYSSEIDKYAIQVAIKNYPDTKHIGSVVDVKASDLPKIDLLIGGSPCQGFSFAGKQLNFEDERSKLFFEFVRLLEECKPKYFLLENVKMKKEYQDVITRYLGVEPILINSSLVSAQNRERLYWTNINNIEQLQDKEIILCDILEEVDFSHSIEKVELSLSANNIQNIKKGSSSFSWFFEQQTYTKKSKTRALKSSEGSGNIPKVLNDNLTMYRKLTPLECERLQTVPDKVFYGIIRLKDLVCLDQAKNYVSAVEKNHRLQRLVLSAEKYELREYVNNAIKSMNVNHQSIKPTAQKNVDMQMQSQIEKCTNIKEEELNTTAKIVEKRMKHKCQEKEEDFAVANVLMNLIEGKIAHNGKVESLLKDNNIASLENGKSVLSLSFQDMMELAKDVELGIQKIRGVSTTFTTSYPLSIENIETMLIISYYFARDVIDGYIPTKIQINNLYLSLTNGYTFGVSNSQRYKMLGNGWTCDVIAHIFKSLK